MQAWILPYLIKGLSFKINLNSFVRKMMLKPLVRLFRDLKTLLSNIVKYTFRESAELHTFEAQQERSFRDSGTFRNSTPYLKGSVVKSNNTSP